MSKVKVLVKFRDKLNYGRQYKVDEIVEFSDEKRVQNLLERKLVMSVDENTPIGNGNKDPETLTSLDLSKPWQNVSHQIKRVEDMNVLTDALQSEHKSTSPRQSVVKALTERIIELGGSITNTATENGNSPETKTTTTGGDGNVNQHNEVVGQSATEPPKPENELNSELK